MERLRHEHRPVRAVPGERRRHPRLELRTCIAPNVNLVDLSEEGAQLEVPWPVPVGSLVYLALDGVHPEMQERVPYHVLGVRPCGEHGRFRTSGFFPGLPRGQRHQLRAAVADLALLRRHSARQARVSARIMRRSV